jgi:hypothetical protein
LQPERWHQHCGPARDLSPTHPALFRLAAKKSE